MEEDERLIQKALEVQRELERRNFSRFFKKAFRIVQPADPYLHNWHVDCISEHLMAMYDGELQRLIINIQPRALKSLMVSTAFPAWLMGKNPATQIICASYAQSLAEKLSVDTRLIIESDWYKSVFPNTIIADDQNQKKKFQTTARGHRIATSVGGTLTGEGGEWLIWDDPLKPDEALSDVMRDNANQWIDQVFMSRANNPKTAKFLGIMQRLHEQDVTGHLLDKGSWHLLKLPTIAEKKTVIQIRDFKKVREEGELLHPVRENEEGVLLKRKDLGEYGFAGQYQQRPVPLGGGEFKLDWLIHDDFNNKGLNTYIIVDPAGGKKGKQSKDYTAMVVVGVSQDRKYYVLDIVRDKELNQKGRQEALFKLVQKWSPNHVGYEEYGLMSDVEYIKEKQKELNFRFSIRELKGTRLSKEDRVRKLIPLFMDGRVILPNYGFYVTNSNGEPQDLVRAFVEEEYSKFPVSQHDDIIDALSRVTDDDMGIIFPRFTAQQNKIRQKNGSNSGKSGGVWY